MDSRLLTATDVANLINIKVSTVYALCRRGVLPHIRIAEGSRRALIRFDPEQIRRFLCDRVRPGGHHD